MLVACCNMLDELIKPENLEAASGVVGGVVGIVAGLYSSFNIVASPATMALNDVDYDRRVEEFRDLPNQGLVGKFCYAFQYLGMKKHLSKPSS